MGLRNGVLDGHDHVVVTAGLEDGGESDRGGASEHRREEREFFHISLNFFGRGTLYGGRIGTRVYSGRARVLDDERRHRVIRDRRGETTHHHENAGVANRNDGAEGQKIMSISKNEIFYFGFPVPALASKTAAREKTRAPIWRKKKIYFRFSR